MPDFDLEVALEYYLDDCRHEDRIVTSGKYPDLPTVEGFAEWLGVHRSTLYLWARRDAGWAEALERIKDIQEDQIMSYGLAGTYDAHWSVMMLARNHGYDYKKQTARRKLLEHQELMRTLGEAYAAAAKTLLRERQAEPGAQSVG